MLTLICPADLIPRIGAALEDAGGHEIGGILMAEHIGPNQFTIADLTVHKSGSLTSFVRRIEEAIGQLEAFFERTNCNYTRFNYIGEWHSHPSYELEPSYLDDAAMMRIVLDHALGTTFAVLLLVKLDSEGRLQAKAHVYMPNSARERCNITYKT